MHDKLTLLSQSPVWGDIKRRLKTNKQCSHSVAAICEASYTKLLLQLIVNFGLFIWVLIVQQAWTRESGVREEMNCQSVFNRAWWDTWSVRPALIEFVTDCLMFSSIKLSPRGFNTCGMRNVQNKQKHEVKKEYI